MRRIAWLVIALTLLVICPLFFFAPVVYSPIRAWDCSAPSPCPIWLAGYESPSCALLGIGTGIDNRTVWGYYNRSGIIGIEVTQKPWTFYFGCPPSILPPPK